MVHAGLQGTVESLHVLIVFVTLVSVNIVGKSFAIGRRNKRWFIRIV